MELLIIAALLYVAYVLRPGSSMDRVSSPIFIAEDVIEYEDGTINYARGEIEHWPNYSKKWGPKYLGDRVIGCRDGYDYIWVYIGNDKVKVISKTEEL